MILLKSSRTSVCVCVCVFVALCCNEHWYTGKEHRGMCKIPAVNQTVSYAAARFTRANHTRASL